MAKNGVFFIDEAPQLAETDLGRDIIKKLLTTVEDAEIMRNVCIIIAGYEEAMQRLLNTDDGLHSRFQKDHAIIHFDNYSAMELLAIMDDKAAKADTDPYLSMPYPLNVSDPAFRAQTLAIFDVCCRKPNFGNGRFARNYLDKCVNNLLARVDAMDASVDKTDRALLTTLLEQDIPQNMRREAEAPKLPARLHISELDTQTCQPITQENYAGMLDRIRQSTVLIIATYEDGRTGTGTGTIISQDGHMLTCNHVLANATSVKVKVYCPGSVGGDYRDFDCQPMTPGYHECDMALGKIEGTNFKFMPIRPFGEEVFLTEETLMVGFPLGGTLNGNNLKTLNSTHYDGRICNQQSIPRGSMYADVFGINSSGMPGNSGSAVFSKQDGRIIGVFTGAIGDGENDRESTHRQNIFFPIKYFWSHFVDFRKGLDSL